jgi:hypothetical protein
MELDEKQDMEGCQLHRLDREEIAGADRGGLGDHELAPGVPLGSGKALRCGDAPAEMSIPIFCSSPWIRR